MDATITAKIVHETEKAVLAIVHGAKVWLPKSQIHLEPSWKKNETTLIDLPMWLVDAKGI